MVPGVTALTQLGGTDPGMWRKGWKTTRNERTEQPRDRRCRLVRSCPQNRGVLGVPSTAAASGGARAPLAPPSSPLPRPRETPGAASPTPMLGIEEKPKKNHPPGFEPPPRAGWRVRGVGTFLSIPSRAAGTLPPPKPASSRPGRAGPGGPPSRLTLPLGRAGRGAEVPQA